MQCTVCVIIEVHNSTMTFIIILTSPICSLWVDSQSWKGSQYTTVHLWTALCSIPYIWFSESGIYIVLEAYFAGHSTIQFCTQSLMNTATMHKLQTCSLNLDAYAISLKELVATSFFCDRCLALQQHRTRKVEGGWGGGGGGLEDCWLISASQFKKASRHCMNCCHPIKGANLPSSSEDKKVLIFVWVFCRFFSLLFFSICQLILSKDYKLEWAKNRLGD